MDLVRYWNYDSLKKINRAYFEPVQIVGVPVKVGEYCLNWNFQKRNMVVM